jgi:hypothetical protein
MSPVRAIAVAIALALATAGAVEAVSSPSGIDPRLRIEWEAGQSKSGRPKITGYVYNDYMRAATGVRLLVETLDASGQVIDRAYGFVFGIVPVFNRTYFDVPLKTAGAGYRITVTAYEWRDGAGN